MMMTIAGLILWYRLPVRPFHKAILLSYLPYVFIFMILLSYIGQAGWRSADLTIRLPNGLHGAAGVPELRHLAAGSAADRPRRRPGINLPGQAPSPRRRDTIFAP
jgi:hypothetical protein